MLLRRECLGTVEAVEDMQVVGVPDDGYCTSFSALSPVYTCDLSPVMCSLFLLTMTLQWSSGHRFFHSRRLIEFNAMSFGLRNATATFERMMDKVLCRFKWQTYLCYLDDIAVFAAGFTAHLQPLRCVWTCLTNVELQLSQGNC